MEQLKNALAELPRWIGIIGVVATVIFAIVLNPGYGFVVAGISLVVISGILWGRYDLKYSVDEAGENRSSAWRKVFFAVWTLALPCYLLYEWHGPNPPPPKDYAVFPPWQYSRTVVTNFWGAVAVVLGLLGFKK